MKKLYEEPIFEPVSFIFEETLYDTITDSTSSELPTEGQVPTGGGDEGDW